MNILPPVDHPIWKLAQTLATVLLLLVAARHGMAGQHDAAVSTIDFSDLAGLVGGGVGLKLAAQQLFRPKP